MPDSAQKKKESVQKTMSETLSRMLEEHLHSSCVSLILDFHVYVCFSPLSHSSFARAYRYQIFQLKTRYDVIECCIVGFTGDDEESKESYPRRVGRLATMVFEDKGRFDNGVDKDYFGVDGHFVCGRQIFEFRIGDNEWEDDDDDPGIYCHLHVDGPAEHFERELKHRYDSAAIHPFQSWFTLHWYAQHYRRNPKLPLFAPFDDILMTGVLTFGSKVS